MRLLFLSALLQAIAAVTAVLLARRRREHRPIAAFLIIASVANIALTAFIFTGAPTTPPASPLTGVDRALGHLRQALYLVWPFGLAAAFIAVFAKRRPWPIAPAYAASIAALVLGYPTVRGDALRQAYLATELGALCLCVGMVIHWARRRESPNLTHTTAIVLLSGELAALAGPWARDIFTSWDMGRVMYIVLYATIALIQGVSLWQSKASSSS